MISTRWLRLKTHAGRVLLVLLVVTAVASVFWYRHLTVDEEQPPPPESVANDLGAEMVTRDFRHVETRMDRTIWVLESARADIFNEDARLHTVKITWYGEPGMMPVVITSESGQMNFRTRNAVLNGKVRIERADGAVLLTEQLIWEERRRLLRAPLPVEISTPNFTFRGESLDANLETQRVILRRRVQGEIRGGALIAAPPA